MENEEWRPIPGTNGLAEVSNLARIRTLDRTYLTARGIERVIRGRVISQSVTRYGYAQSQIIVGGKFIRFRVHRAVAQAFVAGEFEGAEVDHLDGNKLNNRPDNLQWITKSENVKRAWATGLNRGVPTKLTDLKEHAIRILYEYNFPPSVLAEWFGVSTSLAYQVGAGKRRAEKLQSRRKPRLD